MKEILSLFFITVIFLFITGGVTEKIITYYTLNAIIFSFAKKKIKKKKTYNNLTGFFFKLIC